MKTAVKDFIQKRNHLIWSVKDFSEITDESVVENTLNYGDFNDVKELISLIGMKETADIFDRQIRLKRSNYRPEIENYFKLYFKKYASRDIK